METQNGKNSEVKKQRDGERKAKRLREMGYYTSDLEATYYEGT
jgi:hypothetical protein